MMVAVPTKGKHMNQMRRREGGQSAKGACVCVCARAPLLQPFLGLP